MATRSEIEAGLRARSLKLIGPTVISSPKAMRPIYRYSGVKLVGSEPRDFQVDVAVYDEGKSGETAVLVGGNQEPEDPDTTFRDAQNQWIADNAGANSIISWRILQDAGAAKRLIAEVDREVNGEAVTERWLVAEKPDGTIFRGRIQPDGSAA